MVVKCIGQSLYVVEGHLNKTRSGRAKTRVPLLFSGGERQTRVAVVATDGGDDFCASGMAAGHFDSQVDRFAAGYAKNCIRANRPEPERPASGPAGRGVR